MDKKTFCDEMAVQLSDLARFFQLQKDVAPATAQKGLQQDQRRPRREEARTRLAALRARVNAVCADAAPLTDALRSDIEQELEAVRALLR
jgi:hypothetical protein